METGALELDLDCGGFTLHATLTLPESGGVQLRLDGDGPMPEKIAWPPAWKMEREDVGIYPFGTGYAVPAAEWSFPPRTAGVLRGESGVDGALRISARRALRPLRRGVRLRRGA
ncbi:MAG: hypothetical protein L6W00_15225 [Lentisphaeria bacterium]|nr:MAG: hypothetical protein L6W00_15225 [Lentisphaeria bacterium]